MQLQVKVVEYTDAFQNPDKVYILKRGELKIGRSEEGQIVLPDNSHQVSRAHCSIKVNAGKFFLTDLNSVNGTVLNGKHLPPNQPAPLKLGDTVQLGPYALQINIVRTAKPFKKAEVVPVKVEKPDIEEPEEKPKGKIKISKNWGKGEAPVFQHENMPQDSPMRLDETQDSGSALRKKIRLGNPITSDQPEVNRASHGFTDGNLVSETLLDGMTHVAKKLGVNSDVFDLDPMLSSKQKIDKLLENEQASCMQIKLAFAEILSRLDENRN